MATQGPPLRGGARRQKPPRNKSVFAFFAASYSPAFYLH
jgi:hypothetical protein